MGSISDNLSFERLRAKYEEERQKRLRPDGLEQYADVGKTEKYKHFGRDPWKTADNPYLSQPSPVANGNHTKILIVGTGFSALLFAVRFLEAGYRVEDMVFVDFAWGFGGTWYWNRYPGLMCDVESACYMPLLEETGYIPKNRYSYGPELRGYAELVAAKWNLSSRALFGATIQNTAWNDETSEWETSIVKESADGTIKETLQVRSDFFVLASGILNRPKLSRQKGLSEFKGHMFHTSRWDYNYTGGNPENPTLDKLKGKKVAFLGTGATGIQVIPQLAKWAARVTVLQRTPSAVSVRGQRPVDPAQFKQDCSHRGWQRERRENMASFLNNPVELPEKNLVDDGWTHFPSFSALVGSPRTADLTMENVAKYVETLHKIDLPRQKAVRQRVTEIVKDAETAAKLQPWYPGWCKRPCFHDEYLDTFNLPNVFLADTNGHGIDGFTERGVLCNGEEIEADVVILGTGFEPFSAGSPAFRAGITVTGRQGRSMDDKWADQGPGTWHGVISRDFPNLVLSGLSQTGTTVNIVHSVDVLATHIAHVLKAVKKKLAGETKFALEPTGAAEESWSMRVAAGALGYAAIPGCTPSYTTAEGARSKSETPEEQLKMARGLAWSRGIVDFTKVVQNWETSEDLSDLEVTLLK